jgi:miniconductance mechanosensitive channel
MVNSIYRFLLTFGIPDGYARYFSYAAAAVIIIIVCIIATFITRKLLLKGLAYAVRKTKNQFDDALLQNRVFHRLAHVTPALIIYLFAPSFPEFRVWLERFSMAYIILACAFAADGLLNAARDALQSTDLFKDRPVKSYVQMIKILLFFIISVVVIANLMGSSPWKFLSGIGAMSAILLLIFKDAILGFVAGFQLHANRMVSVGDWIEMPKYGADGDVIDISLTTVKVQNWNKTITTIPTYALMSESFKNWRGMTLSGGRRIKRSIHIDINSVKFCSPEQITRFRKIQLLKDYLDRRQEEVEEFNKKHEIDTSEIINGRRLTNLGTFRAYIAAYLHQHPKIHDHMTFLVRQLDPTEHGLPLQLYVFSNDQAWANYEAIQADIFDHLLAVLPEFGLKPFQLPTGNDVQHIIERG